jgi:hypothetical protein
MRQRPSVSSTRPEAAHLNLIRRRSSVLPGLNVTPGEAEMVLSIWTRPLRRRQKSLIASIAT